MHFATGMLHVSRDSLRSALEEFSTAERIQSFVMSEHSLSGQVTGWTIATKARLGMLDEARTARDHVPVERSRFGEIRNASAVIHLTEGDPTAALDTMQLVLDGKAPVLHDFSLAESHLLAARAYMEVDDRRAANDSVERALASGRSVGPLTDLKSRRHDLKELLPLQEPAVLGFETAGVVDAISGELSGSVVGRSHS